LISPRFLEELDGVDPLKLIAGFQGPTLIIHPERDELLPVSHADDYLRAAGSAVKEKVIVPGADHTYTSVAWERQVIACSVEWMARHLAKTGQ